MIQHFGRFGTPEVVHTDRGTAFHNELIAELLRVAGTKQSLTTAYSKEENAIVECANKEVLRHLNVLLFDARVHDKWSYEQLPMVQRIMNTLELNRKPLPGNFIGSDKFIGIYRTHSDKFR